jgi:uncharacterized protein YjbI with pentapeptide repeats
MRIATDETVLVGWIVNKIRPPQLAATFIVKGTYKLRPGQPATREGVELEPFAGDVHHDEDDAKSLKYASDFAPMKPRADLLLVGSAHAPGGVPVRSVNVRFGLGEFSKSIEVLGNRTWESSFSSKTSPAELFAALPLVYENAAGGAKDDRNPVGKAFKTTPPNLTIRARAGAAPNSDPVGFGPLAPGWDPRNKNLGTYNKKWQQTRWPWFPDDFDWGHFNAAPRDQQLDVFPRGDEEITLENLHPKHALYKSRLPGVRARCFFSEKVPGGGERFREVPLKIDTIWIDANEEKLIVVWRGDAEVRTLKTKELQDVLAVTEPLAEAPRSAEHYRSVLREMFVEKADPKEVERAAKVAAAWGAFDVEMAEMKTDFAAMGEEAKQLMAEADQAVGGMRGEFLADGMEAKFVDLPPVPEPTEPAGAELANFLASLKVQPAAAEAAEFGANLANIQAAELALAAAAVREVEFDRLFAENFPEDIVWTRDLVKAAPADALVNANLVGLDLSGLNLAGVNLNGARLNAANLAKANLQGAKLRDADLRKANLAEADLTGALLDDADLKEANLAGAKVAGVSIRDASLSGLALAGLDFSGCQGRAADFSQSKLPGAKFVGAMLEVADFSGCDLTKADFRKANLKAAQFEAIKGPEIMVDEADISGIHASDGCDFTRGSFQKVIGPRAIFEEAILDHADFSRSKLTGATFTDASLKEANLDRVDLSGATFDDAVLQKTLATNSNFLRASFDRADLTEADFQGSNLYEAGFWEAVVEKTNFRSANLKGSLLA